eukprot:CAMPEP_0195011214 /NCGR_PEP_ID=MMETSP0326_2-20130528/10767_1 /TAXON_ID=2866 ORGANISM="Crypthecodinium cohnii, Strain Seligo" /NCGR_SAMPLE_ID=MMETSP0326_2 /ASSEMBLY_ACC=CAM_ASM_000348 /LENGTH=71 /DNA_ID=CAMNT_0040020231 /DNA_START=91 /DNA_END=303 /DNA_ORIENTATION=-
MTTYRAIPRRFNQTDQRRDPTGEKKLQLETKAGPSSQNYLETKTRLSPTAFKHKSKSSLLSGRCCNLKRRP